MGDDYNQKLRHTSFGRRTLICKDVKILDKPISHVWAILSGFGAIKTWMPSLQSCSVEGDGLGAIRTVYNNDNKMQEQLEVYDPKEHFISYRLLDPTDYPMEGCYGSVSLAAKGVNATELTWTATAEKVDEAGIAYVGALFAPFFVECIDAMRKILMRP